MADHDIPKAADIMTRKLITLRADANVLDGMRLLVQHRISGAPVVDGGGVLCGILSEFGCLRILAAGQFSSDSYDECALISDVMSRDVETVRPDIDLYSLAHRFLARPIRRVPVVDNGKLVGLVSRHDVLAGVDRMRGQMREQPKGARPKGLYLSASDPQGDGINSRLDR